MVLKIHTATNCIDSWHGNPCGLQPLALPRLRRRIVHLEHSSAPRKDCDTRTCPLSRSQHHVLPHMILKHTCGQDIFCESSAADHEGPQRRGKRPLLGWWRALNLFCKFRPQDLHRQRVVEDQRPRIVHLVRRPPQLMRRVTPSAMAALQSLRYFCRLSLFARTAPCVFPGASAILLPVIHPSAFTRVRLYSSLRGTIASENPCSSRNSLAGIRSRQLHAEWSAQSRAAP